MEETTPKRSQESYEEVDLSDLLKQYYKRLFPTKLFCDWLEYGDSEHFSLIHYILLVALVRKLLGKSTAVLKEKL